MNEIQLIIKVQSEMKKELSEVKKDLEKLKNETKKTTSDMEKMFKKVGKVVEGVMGATILNAGKEMIKSSEKQTLALKILELKSKDVYNQLISTSDATFGLANKFDMVTAANKAMAFGIELGNGKLTKLMKISSKLAVVMGIDTKQAFDDLITSTARQQKLIADNLGIMINKVKIDTEYAAVLGKTKDKLTEAEQSQAFLNEILKKGQVITGELTDDFIKMNTQGTKAIKTLETAFTNSVNVMSEVFVGLGNAIGWTLAEITTGTKTMAEVQLKELIEFNQGRVEAEMLTSKELAKVKKISEKQDKESRSLILAQYKEYYKGLQVLKEEHEENIRKADIGTKILAKNREKQRKVDKEYYDKVLNLNKQYRLGLKDARQLDFVDFELTLNKRFVSVSNNLKKIQSAIKGTDIFKSYSGLFKVFKDAQTELELDAKKKEAKRAKFWKENKAKVLSERKGLAKEIVDIEKKLMNFNELSNEKQIKAKEKFEKRINDLTSRNTIARLKAIRLAKAKELDIEKDSQVDIIKGLKWLWKDTVNFTEQKSSEFASKQTDLKEKERLRALESERSIFKDLLDQKISFEKEVADAEAKGRAKKKAEAEKHFALMQGFGADYLDAVIQGNADKIPEILAQQAVMFGQQIFWDGLKTLWFGTAENAIFPGLGSNAVAVGVAEMAVGAAMMGGGVAAGNAMSSGSSSKDTGATERSGSAGKGEVTLNVMTSLYGSHTEARKEVRGLVAN